MNLSFKTPSPKEFEHVTQFIQEYELDNRDLKAEEFIVAIRENLIVGFGRLRHHNDCIELCSLGVVIDERKHGIGKAIVNELLKQTTEKIYLVCIIPDFFIPFGFNVTTEYPTSIQSKLDYCTNELAVPEKYVVMKLERS